MDMEAAQIEMWKDWPKYVYTPRAVFDRIMDKKNSIRQKLD